MAGGSSEKMAGCGLFNAVFGRRSIPRRSTSTGSLPIDKDDHHCRPTNLARAPSTPSLNRLRGSSDERSILEIATPDGDFPAKNADRIISRPAPRASQKTQQPRGHNNGNNNKNPGRKASEGAMEISDELETMLADHQGTKGEPKMLRASSNNFMLFGNLGNLRQQPGSNNNPVENVLDHLPRTAKEEQKPRNGKYATSVMGNVVKKHENGNGEKPSSPSLCRAISTRMDPEELKILGNEDYKNGRFAEALALYDAAISIDPNKASYRSNKSAALSALGRLLEAVFECREAIRIEPSYHRAHNRLATLYVRLGEVEKAMYHYKQAAHEADPDVMTKTKNLQLHLNRCTEAKKHKDWNTLLKESDLAISAGADSAPQIFGLKAESLMRLHRYEEADEAMKKGPNFDVDECTKFLGPIGNASLLIVQAQVDMAAGRVEDAVAAAQRASQLDSNSKEVGVVGRRTRAVAAARLNGNELFKAGRFSEASVAYGEGLEHDPYNAVLLCNRAACRTKLGQYEKALEDCNAAVNLRPSFTKARLRRSDCLFKMGKWEACMQECEVLMKETADNEEIGKMMKEAQQLLLRKHHENGSR
ncbi:PREDICTED: inactive TPR repeat-containing thioredoxin TTL3-like [Ipomoea nil]|uniref:inactive TPR repeat-containing thioredoxin TTL3-like n=1 Tax=Ipomoea nil TaxID=35883 RepID=UPI0009016A26|nr:PREDICTED: inactive TPR repeat-containing thioredoxin TTL3-like [Ipomoea nil]